MGAWGYSYFEDDAALDFMAYLEESEDPEALLREALEEAAGTEYLEADAGAAAVVAAAYVDNYVNGTKFSSADAIGPLPVDSFRDRHPDSGVDALRSLAAAALAKVLSEASELRELWEESEEFDTWHQGIRTLSGRLEG